MILRRHQPRRAGRGRRAEGDVQPTWLAPGIEIVEDPDLPRALVHHPVAVSAGLTGVEAVMVGMPPQVRAVELARVEVARPLMVGQEGQPAPGQHGAGELAAQISQDPPERALGRRRPQPPRGAAPVPLPECGVASPAAVQHGAGAGCQGYIRDGTEREAAGCSRIGGHAVRPGEPIERLAGTGEREDLPVRGPAAYPGIRVTPVGEPAAATAVHLRQVHLRWPVTPARPGHERAVPGQPRMADLGPVRGNPPGPAAGDGCEPDVILRDEGEEALMDVRETKVPG